MNSISKENFDEVFKFFGVEFWMPARTTYDRYV